MSKTRRMIACRFCGATCPVKGDALSHWSHSHPARCPERHDRVPALNGVHVGDLWQNRHTTIIYRVEEIRLGGDGVYADREPVYVMATVWKRAEEGTLEALEEPDLDHLASVEIEEEDDLSVDPMWGLAEHADPLTRPGEYPVPIEMIELHGRPARSALDAFRCPGYRGGTSDREDRDKAYWHSFHTVEGHAIQWGRTNELWQIKAEDEPVREAERIDEPSGRRPDAPTPAVEQLDLGV